MGTEEDKNELLSGLFSETSKKGNSAYGKNSENSLAGTFSNLIDVMDIAMWQLDLDYRVVGFNKKAKEIYGEHALGDFCYHAAAKRDTVCDICPARMVYNGQESGRSEHKRTDISGKEIYIDHIATPIKDMDGNVTGTLVLIIDITRFKMQEKELLKHRNNLEEMIVARTKDLNKSQARYRELYEKSSRAEKLYRSLLNSSADAIVIYNLEGEVQYLSPSFNEIFGWGLDELKGKRIPFVPESEQESSITEIRRILATGEPTRNFQTRRSTKDGRLLDIYLSASKYDDIDGNPAGILVILKDVTDSKAMEIQLQRVQKMDALGTLAGGIAHDFNNILAAVMGLIELEYLTAETGSRTHNRMEKALTSCRRARDLVKQILTFSSRGEQSRRPLCLGPVVEDTLQMMRATLPTTIDIQTDFEAAQSLILGDSTQINQILLNLCTNAAYSMRRLGGILGISLKEVEIDDTHAFEHPDLRPGSYLCLIVSDTGEGMDRGTRERIFEPFFTTKGPGEGTGVGLSVVHGIVKSHGGKIVVQSEAGKGSRFKVFFPRIDEQEDYLETWIETPPAGNERILLVDDEKLVTVVASEMLSTLGYEVVCLQRSFEALELFRTQPDRFHLIITDQTMPGMTGMELAAEVLRVRQDIPIILCTGFYDDNVKEMAATFGIRKILSKPFVLQELASSIRDVLDQGREV
jgi:two-component system, cell cycle sensor histidine kinase and response regulator CckA